MFRQTAESVEVFLVHPGGPFWADKDDGAWSIPKGEYGEEEDPREAACREFREETGFEASGAFLPLGEVKLRSGKLVIAWAVEGNIDPGRLASNTFPLEWPPASGRIQQFPEADRGAWFPLELARRKLNPAQAVFLERLVGKLPRPA